MANLKQKYQEAVIPALKEKFGFNNPMLVPKVDKVVINMAFGIVDKDTQKSVVDDLTKITGQKPALCKARKSVSNFKLREGMVIGAKVTLRGKRMYDFLDRFINIVLPRVRDFRGVSPKAFDGAGNYNFGITDQSVFTEIDLDKVKHTIGMNISIVTTAKTDDEARDLLALLGMPFAN